MSKAEDRKLLTEVRERYSKAVEADQDNRARAVSDMKFLHVPGEQWDANMKKNRGQKPDGSGGRPCLEFNRLRTTIKRVINQIRDQRPSGKVRPTEDADKPTAEAMEGLIRNIWTNSDGDSAVDNAVEYQVGGGMGAWRVNTQYSRDDAWDQDIVIEPIPNPLALYKDPASKDPLGRDAEYWFLTTRISRTAYESQYPKAKAIDFEGSEFDDDWDDDDDSVRLVEYWWREPKQETLLLLSDGRSVKESDITPEQAQGFQQSGIQVLKRRPVQMYVVRMCIASGEAILERADWAGSQFPFVQIFGEHMIIDGEILWWGLTRHSRDAQKAYNLSRTSQIETVASAPQAKFWATAKQAQGLEQQWARAHAENIPAMLYNPDPLAPGPPQRMGAADVPAALVQQGMLDAEDIKATSGIYDASLGNRSNETSGIAIRSRQAQSELSVYNYGDNAAKGVRRTWELLLDLIPKIYDSQRQIRVLGQDGSEKYLKINDGVIDLSRGQYDTTVTAGPSFATARQEASETYIAMSQANPGLFPVAGDLIFKSLDTPYAEQIANRLKLFLPPQVQQAEAEGKPVDPQVAQAMQRVDQAMQMVQQQGELVKQSAMEVQKVRSDVEGEKAAADKALADVQLAEANFKLLVSETKAKMQTDQGSQQVASDREALSAQVQTAVAGIMQQSAEFMQQSAAVIADMQSRSQPQVVVANQPRNKVVRVKRVNGELIGTVEET